jgi:hypothetical protein
MRRISTIQRLPAEIRDAISDLREQHTLDEILAHLRALGGPAAEVSRSALGRHVKSLEQVSSQLRRSKMLAESVGRTMGDAEESKVAGLNVQLLHSFLNDVLMSATDENAEEGSPAAAVQAMLRDPKGAAKFAETVERLTKASRNNQEFLTKVEERAARKALQQAAKAADAVAKSRGLSADVLAEIRAGILGVKR